MLSFEEASDLGHLLIADFDASGFSSGPTQESRHASPQTFGTLCYVHACPPPPLVHANSVIVAALSPLSLTDINAYKYAYGHSGDAAAEYRQARWSAQWDSTQGQAVLRGKMP